MKTPVNIPITPTSPKITITITTTAMVTINKPMSFN